MHSMEFLQVQSIKYKSIDYDIKLMEQTSPVTDDFNTYIK